MNKKFFPIIAVICSILIAFSGCSFFNYSSQPNNPLENGGETAIVDTNIPITLSYLGTEKSLGDYNYSPGAAEYIADNKLSAVVAITASTTNSTSESSSGQTSQGTGFIIASEGYILSNAHVVTYESKTTNASETVIKRTGYEKIYAQFNSSVKLYELELIDYNFSDSDDIALLKFKNDFYYTDTQGNKISGFQRICQFADSGDLSYGETAVAIGNAAGLGLSVTSGSISTPINLSYQLIQTDVAINPGNSGGPLFNKDCLVVGIITSKIVSSNVENMGYAIPSNIAIDFLDRLDITVNYECISSGAENKSTGSSSSSTVTLAPETDVIIIPFLGGEKTLQDYDYVPATAEIVADNMLSSVVTITAVTQNWTTDSRTGQTSQGTGFIITADGYLITNAHVVIYDRVVANPGKFNYSYTIHPTVYEDINAQFAGINTSSAYKLVVIDYDSENDLALLKFVNAFKHENSGGNEVNGFQRVCEFIDSQTLKYGESVVAIGNAAGFGLSVTSGVVSMPLNKTYQAIQTDTAINPGNSGGPLFNRNGKVVGVVSSKIVTDTIENIGYAIPSAKVFEFLDTIIAEGVSVSYVKA